MDTPQLVELVTQAAVNVVAFALAVIHLARTARRHEDSQP
jgi:hypothetical protein